MPPSGSGLALWRVMGAMVPLALLISTVAAASKLKRPDSYEQQLILLSVGAYFVLFGIFLWGRGGG